MIPLNDHAKVAQFFALPLQQSRPHAMKRALAAARRE